ncbi:MAG TPA: hypothetical protein EYP87_01395, partial [Flavobacteriaceae bacterium]|nr:hypothetical protein [Flavobacteriaceae bacterium]
AGAFGLAQFMPSSFREYAVDFNGDGHISLFNKADAIGSIANYFRGRGKWQPNVPVTMKAYYNKARFYGVPTGHKTNYTQRHMQSIGMRPTSNFAGYKGNVSLLNFGSLFLNCFLNFLYLSTFLYCLAKLYKLLKCVLSFFIADKN